jgi:DNA-binding XRE family transcriptional regulator
MSKLTDAAEDAADIRAGDEARRQIEAGEDELVPMDLAKRILAGENPVRVWREHRGLSVKELAEQAGVSGPYISQLESGAPEPSADTFKATADVLRVASEDLA